MRPGLRLPTVLASTARFSHDLFREVAYAELAEAERRAARRRAADVLTTRRLPELLLGLAVPSVMRLYMLRFSKSYPDRVTHHEPAHAPAGR